MNNNLLASSVIHTLRSKLMLSKFDEQYNFQDDIEQYLSRVDTLLKLRSDTIQSEAKALSVQTMRDWLKNFGIEDISMAESSATLTADPYLLKMLIRELADNACIHTLRSSSIQAEITSCEASTNHTQKARGGSGFVIRISNEVDPSNVVVKKLVNCNACQESEFLENERYNRIGLHLITELVKALNADFAYTIRGDTLTATLILR